MLFTIHHAASTGGSIISQAIAASTNSVLISEINPYGEIRDYRIKPFYDPTSLLWHLSYNSIELNNINKLKYFLYQLEIAFDHVEKLKKNILLRDHTHTTFNFLGEKYAYFTKDSNSLFLEAINFYYEKFNSKLKPKKNRPILSLRHPLDSFISARNSQWLKAYCGSKIDLNNYCKGLIKLFNYMHLKESAVIVRYEDFCENIEKSLENIFCEIKTKYKIPTIEEINSIKVTGKSGRISNEIRIPPRNFDLIGTDIIEQINNSKYYFEFCKLNNYNPNLKEHPLL